LTLLGWLDSTKKLELAELGTSCLAHVAGEFNFLGSGGVFGHMADIGC
jgi:hypothetical protein